ncbi:MAG: tyrosine-protein phosphatase, partial [Desulfofustis sp.]
MKPDDFPNIVLTVIFFTLLAAMPVLAQSIGGPAAGTLPQLPPGQSLGIALGIPTVPNLRDIGGYKTRDGAIVARGLAYRSDTFNPMS